VLFKSGVSPHRGKSPQGKAALRTILDRMHPWQDASLAGCIPLGYIPLGYIPLGYIPLGLGIKT